MGGKFSHKLEVLLPWILLNINFLKENWQYPHAGWENSALKYFPNCFWDSVQYCTYVASTGSVLRTGRHIQLFPYPTQSQSRNLRATFPWSHSAIFLCIIIRNRQSEIFFATAIFVVVNPCSSTFFQGGNSAIFLANILYMYVHFTNTHIAFTNADTPPLALTPAAASRVYCTLSYAEMGSFVFKPDSSPPKKDTNISCILSWKDFLFDYTAPSNWSKNSLLDSW
jgi:hypothetical protein